MDQKKIRAPAQGLALAALFAGAACIALSPIWVRVSETGATASAFWRVALAVPVLWLLLALSRPRHAAPAPVPGAVSTASRSWPLLLAAGIAFAGDLAFWHASIKFTSVANSTLLANLASPFVTLAAWLFWRQRPGGAFLAGLATALAGVAMLVSTSATFSPTAQFGDALGVVTALFYAWYLMTVKRLRDRGAGTLRVMVVATAVTAAILLPVALASGERMLPETGRGWATLAGLALVSHAGGQGLIAYALAHLPAQFSSAALLLQPVLAAGYAWMMLDEPLVAMQVAGGIVVLAGIYLARRGSR